MDRIDLMPCLARKGHSNEACHTPDRRETPALSLAASGWAAGGCHACRAAATPVIFPGFDAFMTLLIHWLG
jgi:hypothetical protein